MSRLLSECRGAPPQHLCIRSTNTGIQWETARGLHTNTEFPLPEDQAESSYDQFWWGSRDRHLRQEEGMLGVFMEEREEEYDVSESAHGRFVADGGVNSALDLLEDLQATLSDTQAAVHSAGTVSITVSEAGAMEGVVLGAAQQADDDQVSIADIIDGNLDQDQIDAEVLFNAPTAVLDVEESHETDFPESLNDSRERQAKTPSRRGGGRNGTRGRGNSQGS
uniref:Uncharacterized protein n=1 Tax=Chromera velia CCMP2878 TaxID=1169474 RepID=A0A0G4HMX4_9ALVE|eukprot:Cvel_29436.t1-p1 / transcript=Cvel_29436.t1 / gene=Cvel_29436 / organism=Chromera_velia_CCMP2878 / gene_product=hypothetical protein / transcript_product=hypothetical protein / location=Cvel_scaffold4022:3908-4570(+) / protein_length=221 / sequence_SO=supercontig / SO=protein_coding / is_pseudo=false